MRWKITHILCVILIFHPGYSFSQVIDDFSDGNFTASPAWTGNDTDFTVNVSQQLQLNSSGSGISYLSFSNPYPIHNAEWNFWIRLNFSPSGSNFSRVYLASDHSNLAGPLNGYYLQLGENGTADWVKLFSQSGTTSSLVMSGTTPISTAFSIRIKVTRDSIGLWKLFIDPLGGTNYVQEASAVDSTFSGTGRFGVYCKYTSTNAVKFFFDDFYVYAPPDIIPASLDSVSVVSSTQIDVYFSELLDTASAENTANYFCDNGIGVPIAAVQDTTNLSIVHLSFGSNFPSGIWNQLTVHGVTDIAGNITSSESKSFVYYAVHPASKGDIVINEILFDPYTDGVEWIEIYNRSDKIIDLKELSICNSDKNGLFSSIKQISSEKHLMFPQEYLVLSKDQEAVKSQYTTTNPGGFIDFSSFIYLNNDSAYVVIINDSKTIIDQVHYHSEWHLPLLNETKGISLERVNYDRPTQDASNWHSAAENAGYATPSYKNSQYTDGEAGSEIAISPEVFSPDNDGHNDLLMISYAFDTPGLVGNIHIYDARGRLEKVLIRNELLGTSGTFFWDGITDEKLKARIGIYVIYFEAFDITGNVKKYKHLCVVGGKL